MDHRRTTPDKQAQESDSQDVLSRIHPALRASFVALPSNPDVPLTAEQVDGLFAGSKDAWSDYTRDLWRERQSATTK